MDKQQANFELFALGLRKIKTPCTACPSIVGDTHERDCSAPDCMEFEPIPFSCGRDRGDARTTPRALGRKSLETIRNSGKALYKRYATICANAGGAVREWEDMDSNSRAVWIILANSD